MLSTKQTKDESTSNFNTQIERHKHSRYSKMCTFLASQHFRSFKESSTRLQISNRHILLALQTNKHISQCITSKVDVKAVKVGHTNTCTCTFAASSILII